MSLDTRKLEYPGGVGAFFTDLHVSFARWLRFVSLVPLVHSSSKGLTTQEICSYVVDAARQGSNASVLGVCQDRVKTAVIEMLKDEPYFIRIQISDIAKSKSSPRMTKHWTYEPSVDQDVARISFAFRISQRCKASSSISLASLFVELFSAESSQSVPLVSSLHTAAPNPLPALKFSALGPPIGLSPARITRPVVSLPVDVLPTVTRTVEDDVFTCSGSPPSPKFSSPVIGQYQDRFSSSSSALRPSKVRTPTISKRNRTRAALLASAALTPTPSGSRKASSAVYLPGRSTMLVAKSVNLPSPSQTTEPCDSMPVSSPARGIFKNFTPSPRRSLSTQAMTRESTPVVIGASRSIPEQDPVQLSVSRVSTEAPLPLFLSSSSSRGSSPPSSVGASSPCDPRHSLKMKWASLQDSQNKRIIPSDSSAERRVMLMHASSPRGSPSCSDMVANASSPSRMKDEGKLLPVTRLPDRAGFGSGNLLSRPTIAEDGMLTSAELAPSILAPLSSPEASPDRRRQKGRRRSKGKENQSIEAASSDEPIVDFASKPQVRAHAPSSSPSLKNIVVRSRGTNKVKKAEPMALSPPQSRKRRVVLSSSSSSSSCNYSWSSASDDGSIHRNAVRYTTRSAKGKKPPVKKARQSPSPRPASTRPSSNTHPSALIPVPATKPASTSSKSSTASHPPMTVLSSSEAKRKLAAAARVNRPKAEGSPPSAGPAQATCVQRQPTLANAAQTNSAPAKSTSTIPARVPAVRIYQVTRSVNPSSKAEKLSKEIVHESYGQDIPKKTKSRPMQATSRDIATALLLKKTASASAHAKTKRMPVAETAKLAQKRAQVQEKKAIAARAKSKKVKAADEARDEPMEADEPAMLPPREEPKELESGHWAFGANGEALKPKPETPKARKSMLTGVVVTK